MDSYSCSGKFIALKLLLEKTLCIGDFAETHEDDPAKIVLFSQHPAVLELVRNQLLQRYPTLQYVSLTSSQSSKQRMDAVNAFQEDPSIRLLLATTGVCGHGLTLTAARVVILVDHNYNPYVDMQAIDRCHRIGQHSMVRVVRLLSDEANESRLMCLQRFKEHVASTVIKTDTTKEVGSSIQQEMNSSIRREMNSSVQQTVNSSMQQTVNSSVQPEMARPTRGVKRDHHSESEDWDEMMYGDATSGGFTIFEWFCLLGSMKNSSESISLCNQLDSLLVEILKDAKTYVEKKQDFSSMWSDVWLGSGKLKHRECST